MGKNTAPVVVRRSYYKLLEVDPRACPEVIGAAYHELTKKYPRLNDPERELIMEAYSVLSDPDQRAAYDRERSHIEGVVVGSFRVLELIAEGETADIYKGEHILTGGPVCIKHCRKISLAAEEAMAAEYQAVEDVRHYAIPNMKDLIKLDDGTVAIVMSYIPGLTLAQIVERNGPFRGRSIEHVCWIALRCLSGLEVLHCFDHLIHGGLKPSHIMVQNHMAVMLDYGFSLKRPTKHTKSKGYIKYFSPPEAESGLALVSESDFYSLGKCMLFALTGDVEMVGQNEFPAGVPDQLKKFISRLTARDVLKRPSWSDENVRETLEHIRAELYGDAKTPLEPIPGIEV